jgi:hypothetical protein
VNPAHKKKKSQRRFAEFFSGIGLMRMGLENSGWTGYAVDPLIVNAARFVPQR